MVQIVSRVGSQMAATRFKLTDAGWIFAAPTLWPFAHPDHYLVDLNQKARIETIIGAVHLIFYALLIIGVLSFMLQPILSFFKIPGFDHALSSFALYFVMLGILGDSCKYLAIKLVTRALPRTTLQITLAERLGALMTYRTTSLMSAFLFLVASLLFMTYYAITRPFDVIGYIVIAGGGMLAAFYGVAVCARRRLNRSP